MAALLYCTGMRIEEVLGLRWEDIDTAAVFIFVVQSFIRDGICLKSKVPNRKQSEPSHFRVTFSTNSYYSQSKRYSNVSKYVIMETVMRNEAFSDNRS